MAAHVLELTSLGNHQQDCQVSRSAQLLLHALPEAQASQAQSMGLQECHDLKEELLAYAKRATTIALFVREYRPSGAQLVTNWKNFRLDADRAICISALRNQQRYRYSDWAPGLDFFYSRDPATDLIAERRTELATLIEAGSSPEQWDQRLRALTGEEVCALSKDLWTYANMTLAACRLVERRLKTLDPPDPISPPAPAAAPQSPPSFKDEPVSLRKEALGCLTGIGFLVGGLAAIIGLCAAVVKMGG